MRAATPRVVPPFCVDGGSVGAVEDVCITGASLRQGHGASRHGQVLWRATKAVSWTPQAMDTSAPPMPQLRHSTCDICACFDIDVPLSGSLRRHPHRRQTAARRPPTIAAFGCHVVVTSSHRLGTPSDSYLSPSYPAPSRLIDPLRHPHAASKTDNLLPTRISSPDSSSVRQPLGAAQQASCRLIIGIFRRTARTRRHSMPYSQTRRRGG